MNFRILKVGTIVLFLGVTLIFTLTETCEAADGENTFYVGGSELGNYSTIQDAIDNASEGVKIFVYNGTYYENIVVNKSVYLKGENKDFTIIDGNLTGNVIHVTANTVMITGFTIQHSGEVFPNAGINISSNNNAISENSMMNNFYGMTLFHANDNVISDNTIANDDHCGIYMSASSNNRITRNAIQYHQFNGIGMYDASDSNTITENTLTNNEFCGINIRISSDNTITGNTLSDNNIGIHVPLETYNNHISDNSFSNNKNDIETESSMPIFELIIAIIVVTVLSAFVIFWREKSKKEISTTKESKHTLDARGNPCPIPLIMTKKKIAKMKKGEILEIITDDIVAKENIERFGKEKFELVRIDKKGELYKIYIKK